MCSNVPHGNNCVVQLLQFGRSSFHLIPKMPDRVEIQGWNATEFSFDFSDPQAVFIHVIIVTGSFSDFCTILGKL